MPTLFFFSSYRVAIYTMDHRPCRVHVIGTEGEAVFNLCCEGGPVEPRENFGLRRVALINIADQLNLRIKDLCASWKAIHGNF
jgi:hypothetical protein